MPGSTFCTRLQVRFLLRNLLLELRVWILDFVFGNFGGPFWLVLVDWGASGPQTSIPDDLTDLGTQNESSGACLRPDFGHFRQKCERFSRISNFNIKKSPLQNLNFLSRSFLSGSWGVLPLFQTGCFSHARPIVLGARDRVNFQRIS